MTAGSAWVCLITPDKGVVACAHILPTRTNLTRYGPHGSNQEPGKRVTGYSRVFEASSQSSLWMFHCTIAWAARANKIARLMVKIHTFGGVTNGNRNISVSYKT